MQTEIVSNEEVKEVTYTLADLEAIDKKIAEHELGLLELRKMRASIKALVPKRVIPLKDKWWITINPVDLTTSLLRVIDRSRIAVVRSFLSKADDYDKLKGISIVQSKARNFFELFEKTGLDNYTSEKVVGHKRNEAGVAEPVLIPDKVHFRVAGADCLTDDEKKFYNKFIAPRLSELDETPKAN